METDEVFSSIRPRYPELKGRVALVTGSNLGIGKGIAMRLAREGMKLVIHGKEAAEVAKTAEEFEAQGVETLSVCNDFTQPDSVDQLFESVRQHYGHLDLLVNNAADLLRTDIQNATVSLLDRQLAINVRAPYISILQSVPLMAPGSAIVNISSVGAQRAHWIGLPYDVTKGAIDAMTRAMALELAPGGIRVNAIAPGAVRGRRTPPDEHEKVKAQVSRIPMGRLGSALEIGAAVAFLASEDAAYITGHVLVVDGGITAQISPPGQQI